MRKSRLKEPLFDLKKVFPNYFRVWVFRSALLIILLLAIITSASNDWRVSWNYAYCPNSFTGEGCTIHYKSHLFAEEETIILAPGESWGYEPNWLGKNYTNMVWFIVLLAFLLNHWLAKRRGVKVALS